LYYPDGKKFEGTWKEGKKHGKGFYSWPNESKFHCNYLDGVKRENGKLDSTQVSLDELKNTYGNIQKKTTNAINNMRSIGK
jgi:hypothetical protein